MACLSLRGKTVWCFSLIFALTIGSRAMGQQPTPTPTPAVVSSQPEPEPDEVKPLRGTSGYVESAVPMTMFRLRYDSAYNNNRPDRAELFYSQYQQQLISGIGGTPIYVNTVPAGNVNGNGGGKGKGRNDILVSQPGDLIGNPNAHGLPTAETRVDFQDITAYGEWAINNRFSVFAELPWRFLNPEINANTNGFADMNAGFKWAFLASADRMVSFALRAYIPTGDATRGLGTNHVSLEPALLFHQRLTERLTLEGELRDFIPIGGTDFEGNVLRYGLSASYLAYRTDRWSISPVVEFVAWNVLSGKETVAISPTLFEIRNASSDMIINMKVGARVRVGENSDFYIGYGRALTGDFLYKDILRVEYRFAF